MDIATCSIPRITHAFQSITHNLLIKQIFHLELSVYTSQSIIFTILPHLALSKFNAWSNPFPFFPPFPPTPSILRMECIYRPFTVEIDDLCGIRETTGHEGTTIGFAFERTGAHSHSFRWNQLCRYPDIIPLFLIH